VDGRNKSGHDERVRPISGFLKLPGDVNFQFAEIDRRPRVPRQLAGANGRSEHGEASFGAGEIARERIFDANTEASRPAVPFDDAGVSDRAAADVALKPKCLGIYLSITLIWQTPIRVRRFKPSTILRLKY
jgi:hypothetical protein